MSLRWDRRIDVRTRPRTADHPRAERSAPRRHEDTRLSSAYLDGAAPGTPDGGSLRRARPGVPARTPRRGLVLTVAGQRRIPTDFPRTGANEVLRTPYPAAVCRRPTPPAASGRRSGSLGPPRPPRTIRMSFSVRAGSVADHSCALHGLFVTHATVPLRSWRGSLRATPRTGGAPGLRRCSGHPVRGRVPADRRPGPRLSHGRPGGGRPGPPSVRLPGRRAGPAHHAGPRLCLTARLTLARSVARLGRGRLTDGRRAHSSRRGTRGRPVRPTPRPVRSVWRPHGCGPRSYA